ncbi:F0F1 ATP synthase subunit gamma [Candidatus Saccharibacteria bacterium]|nr:F0F1 ATP synthase subunit gamma [Candidatus Saccharibacteria bacterium]
MRQLSEVASARDNAAILAELTSAFESIASMRIAQVKDQVQRSSLFFDDLWRIYSQLRVDKSFNYGRAQGGYKTSSKELMILITSEGSFSGDIDHQLVEAALANYSPSKNDIIVIGYHGIAQLHQHQIQAVLNFKLPTSDENINVAPLVAAVQQYASTVVYYESYISLMQQDVKTLVLGEAISNRGANVKKGEEIISERTYIFEPSTRGVIEHLERAMVGIALSEVILQSKLAQYASRFRANRAAHEKAEESLSDLSWLYARGRRQLKDERLKEIIGGLRREEQTL